MSGKRLKKKSGRYMKVVVALIIFQAIIYTWIHLWLSYKIGLEIAPTTSVAFYTFCVGELSICGLIKRGPSNKDRSDVENEYIETETV